MDASRLISSRGPSDRWLYSWGTALLYSAFGLGMLLLLFITWKVDWILPFIPVVLLGGVAAWFLFQRPLLNLVTVLCCFILVADFEDGIQPAEVFYGLYYLAFLGVWFFKRLFLMEKPVFVRVEDKFLFVFLLLMSLTFPLTLLFGGSVKMFIGEWSSLSLFAFYFPVKEAIEDNRYGLHWMVFVVGVLGLFVLGRNFYQYSNILSDAEQAWQVVKGRAVTNTAQIAATSFFALSLYLYARKWAAKFFFLGLYVAFIGGLILTQSRGYWVAVLFGSLILLLFVSKKDRNRLILTGALTAGSVLIIAMVLFGDLITLVFGGLLDRVASIGSAASKDISLVNRFLETQAVWEQIKSNPVLGHGLGVSYRFYDITYQNSNAKSFIHNGYLAIWYQFGIWGVCLFFGFLGTLIRRIFSVVRSEHKDRLVLTSSQAILGIMATLLLATLTSNPFYLNDATLLLGLVTGIAGGCYSLNRANLKIESTDSDSSAESYS